MIDFLTQMASHQGLPVLILAAAAIVVVVESGRTGRVALWGDLFVDDLDD
jgi:hypothetical protein